jgi:hypothetical protein
MSKIILLIIMSLCLRAEAQIGVKVTLKAGVRTYGNEHFLPTEGNGLNRTTWYTYSGAIYVSKFHTALEWTYREWGRYAFIKTPDFLVAKPKVAYTSMPMPRLAEAGDTIGSLISFSPSWFSISFNVFPNKWKKHQLLLGLGGIERSGGLHVVDYTIDHTWGRESFIKTPVNVSQKGILWKSEYIFMPFKYSLISLRCNYAYFTKFPHGYYEFVLSVGSYIDL